MKNDKEFTGTLSEIANYFNIEYNCLSYRINNMHMCIEDALLKPVMKNKIKIYTVYKNTEHEFIGNLKEIAEHFNINYEYFKQKVRKNKNDKLENIIKDSQNIRYYKIYTVFKDTKDEFTGNRIQIAKHFNISESTLINRIKRDNLSIEEAIKIPLKQVKQSNLIYKDEKGSMRELCHKFDKNFIEVYNKVKSNHTFE